MNRMNRNSSLRYLKQIFSSALLATLLTHAILTSASDGNKHKSDEPDFYTNENTKIGFSTDSIYMIVIKNNRSCLNCFEVASNYLKTLTERKNLVLVAISYSDSLTLARKRNIHELKSIFINFNKYGVAYGPEWNENLITPELLIIKNAKLFQFSYEKLFADGFDFISSEAQKEINKIVNEK